MNAKFTFFTDPVFLLLPVLFLSITGVEKLGPNQIHLTQIPFKIKQKSRNLSTIRPIANN